MSLAYGDVLGVTPAGTLSMSLAYGDVLGVTLATPLRAGLFKTVLALSWR
jgi:hypothetical protein